MVVCAALIGVQGAAAETVPLPPQLQTTVLKPPPDGSSVKAGQSQRPSPARLARRPRKAIVGGLVDYPGALAVLHYFDGTTWQPWRQTVADQGGYYGFRVPARVLYAIYVSTKVSTSIFYPHIGLLPCRQTWADWSDVVRAKRGRVHGFMNTYLRPAQPGCDYP